MDKLSVMRAFCRIVDRGSFVRAAEDLGVSAALLSTEVRMLEKSLGTGLLNRTTRSMSLTDQGRRYYEEALEILNAVDAVEARIREGSGTVAGHLKINAPNSFGQMVIAPLLPKFIEAHPDIILSLSLDDRLIDMVEGGFDLSIRIRSSLPDSSLIVRRIGAVRQRIFASPGYLERAGCPEAPQDLLKHRIIGFLLANHLTAWHLHGPSGSFDIDLRPQVRVGSSIVLRDLLIAGQGIGTLPDFVSNGPEDRGELVRVLPDYELPPPQIFAITAPQMGADGRVRAFLGYLQSALEGSTLQPA